MTLIKKKIMRKIKLNYLLNNPMENMKRMNLNEIYIIFFASNLIKQQDRFKNLKKNLKKIMILSKKLIF
jgi:hypothetical protein